MIILSNFSNFPDELSKNDELREHKLSRPDCKNTGKMGKILEKLMKKYWKNAKKTGKVREIRQSKKVGTMQLGLTLFA